MRAVYNELHNTLMAIDEQEDLRWWKNTHGPGMPTDWPHFQVFPFIFQYFKFNSVHFIYVTFIPMVFQEWTPEKKSKKGKKEVEKSGTIEKRWGYYSEWELLMLSSFFEANKD